MAAGGKKLQGARRKAWVFTVNNPFGEGVEDGPKIDPEEIGASLLHYQVERGESGVVHLQGYVEFKKRQRLSSIKKLAPFARAHFEPRRGSRKQASEYALKADSRIAEGVKFGSVSEATQGKRTDIMRVKEAMDEGARDGDLWEEHFPQMVNNHKAFAKYREIITKKRAWPMDCRVYWGPTGTGKTRAVYDEFDLEEIYSVPDAKGSGTYWDGYDGQRVVLVDEMYGSRFSWGFLLRLTDRYPFNVPVHGGSVNFSSKIIIFTSNLHPGLWYKTGGYLWNNENPFARRVTEVRSFPENQCVTHQEAAKLLGATFLVTSPDALMRVLNKVTNP